MALYIPTEQICASLIASEVRKDRTIVATTAISSSSSSITSFPAAHSSPIALSLVDSYPAAATGTCKVK